MATQEPLLTQPKTVEQAQVVNFEHVKDPRLLGIAALVFSVVLISVPTTRDMLASVQLDNAPVTLGLVLFALAHRTAVHFTEEPYGPEKMLEFFPPNSVDIRSFFRIIIHASWDHFRGNAMQLLLLGPVCEAVFGSFSLLMMMLVTCVVDVVVQTLCGTTAVGASGIVFMLYLLSASVNHANGEVPLTLLLQMCIYLPAELRGILLSFSTEQISGTTASGSEKEPKISHLGHLVGGMMGFVFGLWWW